MSYVNGGTKLNTKQAYLHICIKYINCTFSKKKFASQENENKWAGGIWPKPIFLQLVQN